MDYSKKKTSELLDTLYSEEGALADSKEEDQRIDAIYTELEIRVPFNQYKEEIKELKEHIRKMGQINERLEYFVRGLQIGDVIQKLDRRK